MSKYIYVYCFRRRKIDLVFIEKYYEQKSDVNSTLESQAENVLCTRYISLFIRAKANLAPARALGKEALSVAFESLTVNLVGVLVRVRVGIVRVKIWCAVDNQ